MKKNTERSVGIFIILIGVILFHLINNYIWLKIDQSYLKLDSWNQYHYSLEVFDFFKSMWHLRFPLGAIESQDWHGILVGFITAPFYFIFGNVQDTAVMINSAIFLSVLVFSTYGVGSRILNWQAGILAVFIVTVYPIIFNHSRIFMLDLPLASMVVLSLYFLIASNNFTDRKNSLLFGLSLALGLLIKLNYIGFLIGPLVITVARIIKQKPGSSNKAIKKLIYIIIAAVLLSVIFYLIKSKDMLQHLYQVSYWRVFKNYNFPFSELISWRIYGLLKYVEVLISKGISFLFLVVFIFSLVLFIKHSYKNKWLLYSVIIVPLFLQVALFSILPESMLRYDMPFLPVIAVISSVGLLSIKRKTLRIACILLIITLGTIQFFAVSYGLSSLCQKVEFTILKKPYDFVLTLFQQNIGVPPYLKDKDSHPSDVDWKSTFVLDAIRSSNVSQERIKVLFLSNIPELVEAMEYQILSKREFIQLMPAIAVTMEDFQEKRHVSLDTMCTTTDYLIISNNEDSIWENFFDTDPLWREKIEKVRKVFSENIHRFNLIKAIHLPDGSNLLLYKNIAKPERQSQEISRGNLKLLLDNGRGRIFYKGIEITTGLGMYSSIFSLQHWRDSMEAVWEVKKVTDTKFIAKGRWMFIPVSQTWEIELKEGNIIDWRIKTEAHEPIKIEVVDYKLMLSKNYTRWLVSSGEKGGFPKSFAKETWNKIWSGGIQNKVSTEKVRTARFSLPSTMFYAYGDGQDYIASIENSDQLFYGRVIGCSKKNKFPQNIFSPGKYEYFSANIFIE
jgi:4-amino-4-deoxy-L-arabinose transferase-like glycosyltransferase